MNYLAGFGKKEITCFAPGVGMMGYGQLHNIVKEVATPLWARTMFLQNGGQNFLYIHLEIAFPTLAIKEKVCSLISLKYPEWQLGDSSILITAQHTHSAPGGYSHFPMYNLTIPNFQVRVFETIVNGIIEAAVEAFKDLAPAVISYGEHTIAPDKEVAFNRSMTAYLNNPDTELKQNEPRLAVDRTMRGLTVAAPDGRLRAYINWFGVHCTSISSFNTKIHHDNKGVAAELFEKNHPGSTAFFAQEAAGDVSPNFIWDKKINRLRGKYADQYENAAFNGEIQFQEAEKMKPSLMLTGPMQFDLKYIDMTAKAAAPAHGLAFFKGTLEGPGLPAALAGGLAIVGKTMQRIKLFTDPTKNRKFYEAQAPKVILLDHRDGDFLGVPLSTWKKLPPLPEASAEAFRKTAVKGALETLPWVPSIIPLQKIRIGELLILTLPGEITTMAALRLKKAIWPSAERQGITKIVLATYANAYMGYITTKEEYQMQCYEGGHNVYGWRTLEVITDAFVKWEEPSALPFHFPPAELALRTTE